MSLAKRVAVPVCLMSLSCAQVPEELAENPDVSGQEQALGGIEGTMEYAMDAPWRIEPVADATGKLSWGAIPIQISVHDGAQVQEDGDPLSFGNFCELSVTQEDQNFTQHFSLRGLEEIERDGRWKPGTIGPLLEWKDCRPAESSDGCEGMRNLAETDEWHAQAWFGPKGPLTAGQDIPLKLVMHVTKSPLKSCSAAAANEKITMTNYVTVHLGEAPLPRFDNRWLYGDLHYHSQGTDNEGESGYNYRGVMRAMGALGLDFVLASEHASNSSQIIDADISGVSSVLNRGALRDMSNERFKFLLDQLTHARTGINTSSALDGPGGAYPQGYLSHGVIPQIFLGGEIDTVPETDSIGPYHWDMSYGDGLKYGYFDLCGGWNGWLSGTAPCSGDHLYDSTPTGSVINDVQGLNEFFHGREHLVYLPASGTNSNAFIPSNTTKYGGAARRLADSFEGQAPLLPEIASKGYAFLAHPLNAGTGGNGPDGPPWSDFMLNKAWSSPAILGLQFWNEPVHLRTDVRRLEAFERAGVLHPAGDAVEDGYDFDGDVVDNYANIADTARLGFGRGQFGLVPYYDLENRAYQTSVTGVEYDLHHGAATWDRMLLKGLDPIETANLAWLPANQPRKFFMAAGSDAHGDFNYRRTGYMTGTSGINDDAIAKARNLVFAGAPTLPRDQNIPPDWAHEPAERHSQDQVVSAIAAGNFATSDGPALRMVIDRNRNGVIDESDTPMGGTVELHGESELPLLVEWASTPEFGAVDRIDLYVGVVNGAAGIDRSARIYATTHEGPRNGASLPGYTLTTQYTRNGLTYRTGDDNGYWIDPANNLRISLGAGRMSGVQAVNLPLSVYEAAFGMRGDRFFVRAFAETTQEDYAGCANNATARLKGACIRHYAYTNPVWAITKSSGNGCAQSSNAIDSDGDLLPDGCDLCPNDAGPCNIIYHPPVGGLITK